MQPTGKTKTISLQGKTLTFCNQRCPDWTHPYAYQNSATLTTAGCGIFSLCHGIQWLTGTMPQPEILADFSVANGGRGDDGTDRPALLHAMQEKGLAATYGFRYEEDGLHNDTDVLYDHLQNKRGVALCNLRVGHIVCLVAAREQDGTRQVLAIDSFSESHDDRVKNNVCETIPGTQIVHTVRNKQGLETGMVESYSAFWVSADCPRDFNLLHAL